MTYLSWFELKRECSFIHFGSVFFLVFICGLIGLLDLHLFFIFIFCLFGLCRLNESM